MAAMQNLRLYGPSARGMVQGPYERNILNTRLGDQHIDRIVRAGELEISGERADEADAFFDVERFRFHGPDGFETDYPGLSEYFAALRAAFTDRTIRRGMVAVDGDKVACQTWIEGTFMHPFTHSPVGLLQPNGARVVWDLLNLFRLDERGRILEEFVRTDNRSLLRQLGADGA